MPGDTVFRATQRRPPEREPHILKWRAVWSRCIAIGMGGEVNHIAHYLIVIGWVLPRTAAANECRCRRRRNWSWYRRHRAGRDGRGSHRTYLQIVPRIMTFPRRTPHSTES